jgi:hypothetical protein
MKSLSVGVSFGASLVNSRSKLLTSFSVFYKCQKQIRSTKTRDSMNEGKNDIMMIKCNSHFIGRLRVRQKSRVACKKSRHHTQVSNQRLEQTQTLMSQRINPTLCFSFIASNLTSAFRGYTRYIHSRNVSFSASSLRVFTVPQILSHP